MTTWFIIIVKNCCVKYKTLQTNSTVSPCNTVFALILKSVTSWYQRSRVRIFCQGSSAVFGSVYYECSLYTGPIFCWAVAPLRHRRWRPYPSDAISCFRLELLYFKKKQFTGKMTIWINVARSTHSVSPVPVRPCLQPQLFSSSPIQIKSPPDRCPALSLMSQPSILNIECKKKGVTTSCLGVGTPATEKNEPSLYQTRDSHLATSYAKFSRRPLLLYS